MAEAFQSNAFQVTAFQGDGSANALANQTIAVPSQTATITVLVQASASQFITITTDAQAFVLRKPRFVVKQPANASFTVREPRSTLMTVKRAA